MEISRKWRFSCLLLGLFLLANTLQGAQCEEDSEAPSQCKPFIEKALKEQHKEETEPSSEPPDEVSSEVGVSVESDTNVEEHDTHETEESAESQQVQNAEDSTEQETAESVEEKEDNQAKTNSAEGDDTDELKEETTEQESADTSVEETSAGNDSAQEQNDEPNDSKDDESKEDTQESKEGDVSMETQSEEAKSEAQEASKESDGIVDSKESIEEIGIGSQETKEESEDSKEPVSDEPEPIEDKSESHEDQPETDKEAPESTEEGPDEAETESVKSTEEQVESAEGKGESTESAEARDEVSDSTEKTDEPSETAKSNTDYNEDEKKTESVETESENVEEKKSDEEQNEETSEDPEDKRNESEEEESTEVPEEDLIQEIEIPENLRPREQIEQLLKLDDTNSQAEAVIGNISEVTLKELKRLYENAIKPLETLYKYRDLSNRHYGDAEIFSKPLVLFMGPWSGGKSSIINYLVDNEYNSTSLRTGAEPSPAYFNLLMHGEEPEVLDGTQLAADFTFAGLQKFGQGLEERLRGLKLPSKLLEKVNVVEIPGILEVRKQVSRVFPFNDACQWFIDRADIIFLVYDPSKLDVGPETEAILDQLKGREHQTRIVLNKADQVKPEELMRVQSALIWNISPLMSSAQPPIMYTTSLWSRPYESWAPVRLLQAQERAFLRDLRSAIDKRIENKISSARRFAVRVRNHAKMVDCYLTTYYNHKSVFGNRKQVSDQIIEHPQDYHIYEGLSTLTNISRYDLPDPDVYRDFFRLNALYEFQQLSATCTYFRGCPINRLDIAIAYDLPEMVGKHKKLIEAALAKINTTDS